MKDLAAALDELLAALARAGSAIPALLAPGLGDDEIGRLTTSLPYGVPPELRALYAWRNGLCGDGSPDLELFAGGYWLSLEQALALREEQLLLAGSIAAQTGVDSGLIWRAPWLPVFVDFSANAVVVVCDGTAPAPVWFVAGDDPDERRLEFDDIGTLVRTVAACWDGGIFAARSGGVEVDERRYLAIWRERNPVASAQRLPADAAELARGLAAEDPLARASAARASAVGGDVAPFEALVLALEDPDGGVRAEAAAALARLKDPRSGAALTAALGDPNVTVRARAAAALGALRHKPAVAALIAGLHDPELPGRIEAARALVALRDPASIPALVAATTDPSRDVRQLAAGALARIRHPDAREAVDALADDEDPVIRAIVGQAGHKRRG